MKSSILFVVFVTVMSLNTQSQNLFLRSYTEFTHVSPKQGVSLTCQSQQGLKFGVFYQQEISKEDLKRDGLTRKNREISFTGLYLAFPCVNNERLNLDFGIRTGVKNGKYFSIMPSLVGGYKIHKRIGLVAGISTRNFRPTMIVGLSAQLNR